MLGSIAQLIRKEKCFAFFRLPNKDDIRFLMADNAIILDDLTNIDSINGFIIAPFDFVSDEENYFPYVLISPTIKINNTAELKTFIRESILEEARLKEISFEIYEDKKNYETIFEVFKEQLAKGNFSKLVLSRESLIRLDKEAPIATLFARALQNLNSFVFLCHTPQTGTWLGCSPELFLSNKKDQWQTVSLAGTRKNIDTAINWDKKNKQEQAIVTEYITNVLEEFSPDIHKSETFTSNAVNIQHLRTNFSFTIKGTEAGKEKIYYLKQLINKLYPTPAICGFPKNSAKQFISRNEGYKRGYYSGFLGYVNQKEIDLYINIRSMKISGHDISVYAGGGIMPDSDMESEWKETENKMQAMISLL